MLFVFVFRLDWWKAEVRDVEVVTYFITQRKVVAQLLKYYMALKQEEKVQVWCYYMDKKPGTQRVEWGIN